MARADNAKIEEVEVVILARVTPPELDQQFF